jgi:threonyl-tRNA synthetase
MLGSLERFIANLTEHLAGKWCAHVLFSVFVCVMRKMLWLTLPFLVCFRRPFWLSPRQCIVIPVGLKFVSIDRYPHSHVT